ncbi:hypothetical protein I553_3962 [Mycobacterium xenopi 4042]|uniref:Uncharacterized protein n=1 Tax=Mycobacterium xenopi 4042 TaxID=1299334 RepID=X7ZX03_MYCXE|nr:hypothetical protein I553_3962 [Mycobacterium xenopi 4042]
MPAPDRADAPPSRGAADLTAGWRSAASPRRAGRPAARALFAHLTAAVEVSDDEVATTTPATRCDSPPPRPAPRLARRPLRPPLAQVRPRSPAPARALGAAPSGCGSTNAAPRWCGGPGYEHPATASTRPHHRH